MDFKNSQARKGRAFRHLWQMKKLGKFCLLFESVQPISLRALETTNVFLTRYSLFKLLGYVGYDKV